MAKIALLLAPGFADWEYGLIAGTGRPFFGLDVRFFDPAPGTPVSQGGLAASIPQGFDDLRSWQPDVAAVAGGTIWESSEAPDLRGLLAGLHARGAAMAGICGGTLALARAGLLGQARHTSNHPSFLTDNATGYDGASRYCESANAVSDRRVITAPGTAPASLAAAASAAAGLAEATVAQFRSMMAAEHA
ncbi:DJ-1/PfpI family protein [Cribrihabitans pelagius]|uniref:DJ-1/PfpI family protein n=1 Tax=Cribrihabitans pelagius TaxID=1765746 RepID=UPI003B5A5CD3